MHILKRLLLMYCLWGSGLNSTAQTDAKAQQWLQQAAAQLKKSRNSSIQFSYSYTDFKKNINRESEGQLLWDGKKYLLLLMGTTKLFDGQWVYTIVPEDEEVLISSPKADQGEQLQPATLLKMFDQKCDVRWDIEQKVKGRRIQYIKLIPKATSDPRKEILLGIDAKSKKLYTVIEVRRDGARTTLKINDWKNNQKWTADQFVFKKALYPGYYIHQIR